METLARGNARKLITRLEQPVNYRLALGETKVELNSLLGSTVRLRYTGKINCVHCGRNTNKSFNQGYCYPCFQTLAQCDSCIIHPEKCHYDQGTCREPSWGEKFCMQDHIVYLANSSGLKVGITRATQIPTRWIDQGAIQALPIVRVRSRLQSGALEVIFRQHVADKTNWRDMLREGDHVVDLLKERDQLLERCRADIDELIQRFGFHAISVIRGIDPVDISYPVEGYPQKITSFSFDKEPLVEGTLLGIKGQYLMFDTGVINIRRFGGYELELMN
ncbi:DUF2797 domain-containing protein [Pseudohongiella spirulinae]|uniref:DUF2797 domain-containing protein n=1 Tax=Pseudohongiella spirulinae TaxID=1249552 RepID=A0A0S2KDZ3_9GAMM|nr:DUF2797 domain-containing protein [Pseudohongiella spirulinae]ALO46539.1 hypothetical protein PS2015_1892 [Pseudohongiella spirulinae]